MKKMHHSFFENGASINVNSQTFLTCNIIYNKIRIYDLTVVIINISKKESVRKRIKSVRVQEKNKNVDAKPKV